MQKCRAPTKPSIAHMGYGIKRARLIDHLFAGHAWLMPYVRSGLILPSGIGQRRQMDHRVETGQIGGRRVSRVSLVIAGTSTMAPPGPYVQRW